jgi:hypothetical protein
MGMTIPAGKMIAMANNKAERGSQSAILTQGRSTPFVGLFRPTRRTWLLAILLSKCLPSGVIQSSV